MQRRTATSAPLALVAALLLTAIAGCEQAATVDLVPIYPLDPETNAPHSLETLQSALGFDRIEVALIPSSSSVKRRDLTLMAPDERLSLNDLEEGWWRIEVSGLSANEEKLFGESTRFEVRRGQSQRVSFPIARSFAFNLFEWPDRDSAKLLKELERPSAIAYEDAEGRQKILVTGGRRGPSGPALDQAFIVDATSLETTVLDPLPHPRVGHTSFVLNSGSQPRIAIVGGDAERPAVLVFDTATRQYTDIPVLDGCGKIPSTDGAFPSLVVTNEDFILTGEVVVPLAAHCIVNTLTGVAHTAAGLEEPAPSSAALTAMNRVGDVALMDGSVVYAERAFASQSCRTSEDSAASALFGASIQTLAQARLWPLVEESKHRFLLVGDNGGRLGWSVLHISSCGVQAVSEGSLGPGTARRDADLLSLPRVTFDTGDIFPEASALLVGGRDKDGVPSREVLLFMASDGVDRTVRGNVWLPLSSERLRTPLRLGRARAGHVAVSIGARAVWILGGEATGNPELFMLGQGRRQESGATETGPYSAPLSLQSLKTEPRNPGVHLVTVVDTTSQAKILRDRLTSSLADHIDSSALLSQVRGLQGMVFLAIASDLGVTEDALAQWLEEPPQEPSSGCRRNVEYEMPGMLAAPAPLTALRVQRALTELEPELEPEPTEAGCRLRQTLRALIDGLTNAEAAPVLPSEHIPKVSRAPSDPDVGPGQIDVPVIGQYNPKTDITVALLPVIGDDCSEALLPPRDGALASPEILETCHDPAFDDYFASPPSEDEAAALVELLRKPLQRLDSFYLAVLGNTAGAPGCTLSSKAGEMMGSASIPLLAPRRLLASLESLSAQGVAVHTSSICDESILIKTFEQRLEHALVLAAAKANVLQACIPRAYQTGEATTKTTPVVPRGTGLSAEEDLERVAALLAQRCQVFYAPTATDIESGAARTAHSVQVSLDAGAQWGLRDASETALTCDAQATWVIEFDSKDLWLAMGHGIADSIENGFGEWKDILATATEERSRVAIMCVE